MTHFLMWLTSVTIYNVFIILADINITKYSGNVFESDQI